MTQTPLDKAQLREAILINAVLTSLTNVTQAKKLDVLAADTNPVVAFGTTLPDYGSQANESSIQQVRINVNSREDEPHYKYFRRIAVLDRAGQYGFSASAWLETDKGGNTKTNEEGKLDLRLCYPGFTAPLHTGAMLNVKFGGLNPQVYEVRSFIDKALRKVEKEGIPIGSVITGSQSMGVGNGLASHLYFKHRYQQKKDVRVMAILNDPWGASGQQDLLVNASSPGGSLSKALVDNAPYEKNERREMLIDGVYTIQPSKQEERSEDEEKIHTPASKTMTKIWMTPGTPLKNQSVGQEIFVDAGDMKDMRSHKPAIDLVGPEHWLANIAGLLFHNDADIIHVGNAQNPARSASHRRG